MNKVALVTGASSGIGEAIATQLIAQGWTVFAAARRMDRMSALGRKGARSARSREGEQGGDDGGSRRRRRAA